MNRLRSAAKISAFAVAVAYADPALASDIHGRIELQDIFSTEDSQSLSAALGLPHRNDLLGDVRLIWEPKAGPWSFSFHYEISADWGDTPALASRETPLDLLPPSPPSTLWNLENMFTQTQRLTATQRIDRFSVSYAGEQVVLRVGRQALTWGSGLVFHPMDLFDPFAPGATDTEYKPGADMIYGQYLFDDGSDLQLVLVPRAQRANGPPSANSSSYALHLHTTLGPLQVTGLVARDRRDVVAGISVNGPLGGATWNVELVPTFVHGGGTYTSAVANISEAATLLDRDLTLFAEYYRNGFGLASDRYALDTLPAPLTERLVRGQVFDTGRDYLSAGANWQWSPLVQLSPTLIVNLNDASLYQLVQLTWSLRENTNLIAGGQFPLGPSRSEFGGIPLTGSNSPFFEQPARLYVQLREYF